ncbi:glycoside hydrolase family 3 C-terminal domain-containing protein [Brevibacterium salitolerans]|uniref:Glycoside hydrolase family 3 C-terminal domain-containing protein n=1 Tax=Brevibacterium salitolerans TaxID=1403566 RepID=A0ABP5I3X2_9MICO
MPRAENRPHAESESHAENRPQLPDSLEDRAALGSGENFWHTRARGGIPSITLSDGPHGLRKQTGSADHLGLSGSVPATCFPPAVGLGQSWDPALAERVGRALGREARAADVQVLLGPGINLKRSPLGGRNFEYFSEDPLHSGVLGAAWVRGVQAQGVGASLKHFALNNQEDDRMRVSADVDPRPLRELYLRAFRRVVTQARPWTVMCAYNAVNGVAASENRFLLTQLLREEWGWDGAVVSDWGAIRNRVAAVAAGLDLAMPSDGGAGDAQVVSAVRAGELDPAAVDRAARNVAVLATRGRAGQAGREQPGGETFDAEAHHSLAREAAARSIVLLQNDDALLPLGTGGSLAVIGEFARTPRYQGGGSSHVNPTRLEKPLEEIRAAAPQAEVSFAPGFTVDGSGADPALVAEAVAAARAADTAVVFLGLADAQESEGFDRTDIELPAEQLEVLAAVARVQPRSVVVLSHGGALRLAPVVAQAPAVLDGALLGQAGGSALAAVLFGEENPSGRLAETLPVRLEDTPAFLGFRSEHRHVRYGEGLFVGYRWYDARLLPVEFPFGHGLSYTRFAYEGLSLRTQTPTEAGQGPGAGTEGAGPGAHGRAAEAGAGEDAPAAEEIVAEVTVTNIGDRAGREVVQAYVSVPDSSVARAPRSLGGFADVELEPGESARVEVRIQRTELEYWDTRVDRFVLEPGRYEVAVGASSRDLRCTGEIELEGESVRLPLTLESTVAEVLADPVAAAVLQPVMGFGTPGEEAEDGGGTSGEGLGVDMARMMADIPLAALTGFSGGAVTREQLAELLETANAQR